MGNFAHMMQSTAHDAKRKRSMDVERQAQIISPKDCDSKGQRQYPKAKNQTNQVKKQTRNKTQLETLGQRHQSNKTDWKKTEGSTHT